MTDQMEKEKMEAPSDDEGEDDTSF